MVVAMDIMRNRLGLPGVGIPMALLFGVAICLAILATWMAAAWIAAH